jgi:hypothetical protein
MAEPKTRPTKESVDKFIAKVAGEERREDCASLVKIMKQATKAEAVMWGPSIVGFGTYQYVGSNGRPMDWPLIAFSPRKSDLTLYVSAGREQYAKLLAKLGKHKTRGGCLYLKRLSDVDLAVLKELVTASARDTKKLHAASAKG